MSLKMQEKNINNDRIVCGRKSKPQLCIVSN